MTKRRDKRCDDERGEATVEFIGLVAVLVIPIVYLVVALAQIQAGLFAVEAGAREAARVLAEDPGASMTAAAQVDCAFSDFHVHAAPSIHTDCQVCDGVDRDVRVTVSTSIPLPLIPRWFSDRAAFPVSATSMSRVEQVNFDE